MRKVKSDKEKELFICTDIEKSTGKILRVFKVDGPLYFDKSFTIQLAFATESLPFPYQNPDAPYECFIKRIK